MNLPVLDRHGANSSSNLEGSSIVFASRSDARSTVCFSSLARCECLRLNLSECVFWERTTWRKSERDEPQGVLATHTDTSHVCSVISLCVNQFTIYFFFPPLHVLLRVSWWHQNKSVPSKHLQLRVGVN